MKPLRAIVIIDHGTLAHWQMASLEAARDCIDIVLVANCTNTRIKRRYVKHFFYYAINALMMRSAHTRSVPYPRDGVKVVDFASEYEKAWQRIPHFVTAQMQEAQADVVIKFGMSLLRDPEKIPVPCGVLSYHHGDPEYYRGRPAGFYELMHGATALGIIVQQLSNTLDGGGVWVRVHSKITPTSYRKTLNNAYRNSIPLLRKALINIAGQGSAQQLQLGPNYTLPTNAQVAHFIGRLFYRNIRRVLYGIFFEKKWNIALNEGDVFAQALAQSAECSLRAHHLPKIEKPYTFYADPFWSTKEGTVLVEALHGRTGMGDIIALDIQTLAVTETLLTGNHHSYPQTFIHETGEYLLPETASYAPPTLYRREGKTWQAVGALHGLETQRLVDATYFSWQGMHYLFASDHKFSSDTLCLYVSDHLQGPYQPHPHNPIIIDPARARMAGDIVAHEGALYRLGQNNSRDYGDGISISRIDQLSPTKYAETGVGSFSVEGYCGPHTWNRKGNAYLFDFYTHVFNPLAGVRRLMAKIL